MSKKQNEVGVIGRVSLKVTVALLLAVGGIGFIGAFFALPALRTELAFAAAIIGGGAAIYTAYYAGLTLHNQHEHAKVVQSIHFLDDLFSLESIRIRVILEEKFDHKSVTPAEFHDAVVSDSETHTAVRFLLNRFEDISIAIQRGFADESVLYHSLSFIVPHSFHIYTPLHALY